MRVSEDQCGRLPHDLHRGLPALNTLCCPLITSIPSQPSGPLSRPRGPGVGQIRTRGPRRVRLPADLEWPVEYATRCVEGRTLPQCTVPRMHCFSLIAHTHCLKGRLWSHVHATQGGLRTCYDLADPPCVRRKGQTCASQRL